MTHPLFERRRKTLDGAVAAIRSRGYWSAYPEVPSGKIYGEAARDEGKAAFDARLNRAFAIDQPGTSGGVGGEVSPYGLALGVRYPKVELGELVPAAERAMHAWGRAPVEARVGVCLEILHRLNQRSFELANAVMHTTGQGFMMAFQAGGPHAQDRGLEALAYAWMAMTGAAAIATWEKQVSKTEVIKLNKTYRITPRGVAAVIGCSTFPTWNSYPGLFASLVTGNAVIVKPHPGAILPLAITVEIARAVLREAGFDANVVTLAADSAEAPITRELATRPQVKIVDYTGSSEFGQWIEEHATQAAVFTEKAGVNSVIIDSVDDLKAMAANLAFTFSLYSGQMCTASQNVFIPATGVKAGGEQRSADEIVSAIVDAVNGLLSDPKRAAEVLGAIQSEATVRRIDAASTEAAKAGATILRKSEPVANEQFPGARVRSPLIIKCNAVQRDLYMREMFGPIVYIIMTRNTAESIAIASESAKQLGAITWSAYSTDPRVLETIEESAAAAGASLSCNLAGQIYVNQSAAFSDYHVSGANPAGNATLCDAAFVTPRFRIAQSRSLVPAAPLPASESGPAVVSVPHANPARARV